MVEMWKDNTNTEQEVKSKDNKQTDPADPDDKYRQSHEGQTFVKADIFLI